MCVRIRMTLVRTHIERQRTSSSKPRIGKPFAEHVNYTSSERIFFRLCLARNRVTYNTLYFRRLEYLQCQRQNNTLHSIREYVNTAR